LHERAERNWGGEGHMMRVSKKQVRDAINTLHAAGYIRWEKTNDTLTGNTTLALDENKDAKNNTIVSLSIHGTRLEGDRRMTKLFNEQFHGLSRGAAAGK
jgi:hypothetical protein